MELTRKTACELQELLQAGSISGGDICADYQDAATRLDPQINAFVHVDAPEIQRRSLQQFSAPLQGIPIAIKDNICVKDELTTCASRILDGFRPPYHATVIEKLIQAGALLMGKVNMDEFAFGSSCETSCYGPTHNPWQLDRAPGGSSGGCAAAVAGRLAPWALGSDTGGSIRQPASLCGIVGLKPTYGRVSRYGLIAFASSLDQIGPLTRDVADAALLLTIISGYDPNDSTSVNTPVRDYLGDLKDSVKGLKIGIPKEYFIPGIEPGVKHALEKALGLLQTNGAKLVELSLPHTSYAVATYYIVAPSEASSNLARFDGVRFGRRVTEGAPVNDNAMVDMFLKTRGAGFGTEAKRRIILGTYALSSGYYDAYYLKALKVRSKISQDFTEAFKKCDCIITPTSPTGAFKIGERLDDPLAMYLSDIFTISANLAGIPALSVPCGFTEEHLPVGLQILGRPFDEQTILNVGHAYQQMTDWHKRVPPLLKDE